ncbi:THO complex subunit 1-like [Vitis riparia]|uniref:THO complex subunit 1-like n=1 Tax=Vitis riparia TaxID=96939 RepID=UPI00155AC7D4|nr:THO complex subunit 1-like [Vitis riparia]
MEIFKQALLKPGPPESFALQVVQEAIKPQKQTKLAQDENQLLENILRKLLQELVSCAVQSGEKIMQYGQSIDDEEAIQSQIPRLLGLYMLLMFLLIMHKKKNDVLEVLSNPQTSNARYLILDSAS